MRGKRGTVLSGAGISTESGIPDYRGASSKERTGRPMFYREFMGSPEARARYWARSMVGWPRMSVVKPNAGHRALAVLEAAGAIHGIITQNVDGLHQAAGSIQVLELHGALAEVRCTECGGFEPR
ncbi:MAG TPA: Sir2 family NAD-dependent protein deacetylase, partial [Spirochaetia bacterium]|nr:Sir2 family NAD-dependent protein deacetylase [Spirochaetia bacterium]